MSSSSLSQKSFDYFRPMLDGKTIIEKAWAKLPTSLSHEEQQQLMAILQEQCVKRDTVLVAHYYVDAAIQDLALATGGIVADSLEMARFGRDHPASQLIVAGVRFMGETAKILSPQKTVLMPDLEANCSLDLGCPVDDFSRFCEAHPERTVVVYANTSAAVKAQADWMVTSSCALPIIEHLKAQGQSIVWAPDRHLGHYIHTQTSADMLIWDGACIVHDEFKAEELLELRKIHPKAKILVHPESPASVVAQADVVGSTSALLKAGIEGEADQYIVATDQGLLHRMRQLAPHKQWIAAPTAGTSATCKSCAYCPWMAMNSLAGIYHCLENKTGEVHVPEDIRHKALGCIQRMLDFTAQHNVAAKPPPAFTPNLGAV